MPVEDIDTDKAMRLVNGTIRALKAIDQAASDAILGKLKPDIALQHIRTYCRTARAAYYEFKPDQDVTKL